MLNNNASDWRQEGWRYVFEISCLPTGPNSQMKKSWRHCRRSCSPAIRTFSFLASRIPFHFFLCPICGKVHLEKLQSPISRMLCFEMPREKNEVRKRMKSQEWTEEMWNRNRNIGGWSVMRWAEALVSHWDQLSDNRNIIQLLRSCHDVLRWKCGPSIGNFYNVSFFEHSHSSDRINSVFTSTHLSSSCSILHSHNHTNGGNVLTLVNLPWFTCGCRYGIFLIA